MLADLVRTDRHHHRTVAPHSELLAGIKVLARAHQNLIWTRRRQTNAPRSALREYYPGALAAFEDLDHPDALAVLVAAPDPERGRKLSEARLVSLLRRAGRQRNLERRAREIRTALRIPQLAAPALVVEAQVADTSARMEAAPADTPGRSAPRSPWFERGCRHRRASADTTRLVRKQQVLGPDPSVGSTSHA